MGPIKVSVVIPIYNVADYLPRCIESVISQEVEGMEIILVDDGSTDESGKIADQYSISDPRIKVFHKKNGGLSDARNRGVQEARGEFIFFIDSDDWLTKDALKGLCESQKAYDADIVVCNFYYAYDTSTWIDKRYWEQGEEVRILNNKEAMKALIENEYLKNFAWGKLYKRECIQGILFEKGKIFEDVAWQPQVFARSKKCVVLRKAGYYYYQRENSIVAKFDMRKIDMIRALQTRHHFIEEAYSELIDGSWHSLLKGCLEYYILLSFNQKVMGSRECREKIRDFVLEHRKEFERCCYREPLLYRCFKLFCLHPFYFMGYRGIRKMMRLLKLRKEQVVMLEVEPE